MKKQEDNLTFYVDGSPQTNIKVDIKQTLYGLLDVYGQATCAMLEGKTITVGYTPLLR